MTDHDFITRLCSCLEHPPSKYEKQIEPASRDLFADSLLLVFQADDFEPVKGETPQDPGWGHVDVSRRADLDACRYHRISTITI